MHYMYAAASSAGLLFVAVLVALAVGRRLGARRGGSAGDPATGTGAVDAAVFALLGLC